MSSGGQARVAWRKGRVLAGLAMVVAFTMARAAPEATETGSPAAPGPVIRGVWMGMVTTVMGFNQPASAGKLQPRWRIFLDQGVLLTQLPNDGLAGLDLAARAAGRAKDPNWHQYTFGGATGSTRKEGTSVSWKLELLGPDQLRMNAGGPLLLPGAFASQMSWTYENAVFHRCPSVDGLRLEGSWTTWFDPKDPELDRKPPGQRPVIHFHRDGRFVDDGVFSAFGTGRPGGLDGPGQGRYELRDHTLILRFDDGRVRHEAFTGLLGADPATASDVIYIRKWAMRKR